MAATGAKPGGQHAGPSRMAREKKTVGEMIRVYCGVRHAAGRELCPECRALLEYALSRLERCPFGADKPVCAKCPIHCYKPRMRERIREVMRVAGPRLALRRPWLSLQHYFDAQKPAPSRPGRAA